MRTNACYNTYHYRGCQAVKNGCRSAHIISLRADRRISTEQTLVWGQIPQTVGQTQL